MLKPESSSTRERTSLDALWRFAVDTEDMPAPWSNALPGRLGALAGGVWYRRTVRLPQGWAGTRVLVRVDAAAHPGRVYVDDALTPEKAAEWGIRTGVSPLPAVFGLLAVLVMTVYPLTDNRHVEIVADIAARRAPADQPPASEPSLSTAALCVEDGTPTTRPS